MVSEWSLAELGERIESGDLAGSLRFVRRCDAGQRAEVQRTDPWARVERLRKGLRNANHTSEDTGESVQDLRVETATLVAQAVAIYEDLDQKGLHPDSVKPAVIERWIEERLGERGDWINPVLALVLSGDFRVPESDEYQLAVMRIPQHRSAPRAVLRLLPQFMSRDLWRLFELEGGGDSSLAAVDKYTLPDCTWSSILRTFSESGEVSRSHLLDASLDALDRDFAQFRAGWFSRFHEALAPTVEERAERVGRYLRLIGSSIPPTVSFALKALTALERAKRALPVGPLLDQVSPALHARAKAPAMSALRLISSAAKRDSTRRIQAASVAAAGLTHADAEVQAKTIDLIEAMEATADPDIRSTVHAAKDTVAPALQRRIGDLLGEVAPERRPLAHTPRETARTSPPRPKRVPPIQSFEELVGRCSYILENAADSIEVERVIGGLSRLGNDRPSDWEDQVGPLQKRITVLSNREEEDPDPIQRGLIELFACWLAGDVLRQSMGDPHRWKGPSTIDLFRERLHDVTHRLAKGLAISLLSEVTHERGWIDARILVERAIALQRSRPQSTDLADEVLALLRLSENGRAEALRSATALKSEFGSALRYALGSDDVKVGRTAALWIASARSRDPRGDHPIISKVHSKIGVGGPRRSLSSIRVHRSGDEYIWHELVVHHEDPPPRNIPWSHPTVLFHSGSKYAVYSCYAGGACGFSEASVRWSATIAPGCTEDYFELAAIRLDTEWSSAQWEVRCFFEPLLEADVTLGPNALLLIALGLGAKESGQSGMGIDACVAGFEDGRLDAINLGRRMAELFPTGMVKIRRWAKALAEVVRVSGLHASAVRDTIQATLRGDPTHPPKDLAKLLDVWLQSAVQDGACVTDPQAREYLEGLTVGGKVRARKEALLKL